MSRAAKPPGFTLIETVVSLFLLIFCAMMSANLFRLALVSEAAANDQKYAVMLAETALQQLQIQSRNISWWTSPTSPTGQSVTASGASPASTLDANGAYTGSTTTPWFSTTYTSTSNTRFSITVAAWRNAVYSPSRNASTAYPMIDSERIVKVTVSWRPDGANLQWPRNPSISLVGTVRIPDQTVSQVVVTPASTNLAAFAPPSTGVTTISATAMSSSSSAIPDNRFHFYLSPETGNGTLQAITSSNSSSTTGSSPNSTYFANFVVLPQYTKGSTSPTCVATGGTCSIHVRCVEGAEECWGTSSSITLAQSSSVTPPWPSAIFGSTPPWPW